MCLIYLKRHNEIPFEAVHKSYVNHFFEIFDPILPLSPIFLIGLWSNVTFWQVPLPPKWVTSFMDGPFERKRERDQPGTSVYYIEYWIFTQRQYALKGAYRQKTLRER